MLLKVKVKPNSIENKIVRGKGQFLVIHVKAPREKGLANKALIKTISTFFSIPEEAIVIKSGRLVHTKEIIIDNAYAKLIFGKFSSITLV